MRFIARFVLDFGIVGLVYLCILLLQVTSGFRILASLNPKP